MSQAFLRLSTNIKPRPLVGCNTLQHTLVELSIQDPDHKTVLEMLMSTDQFLRLMIGNSHVECTLAKYPAESGGYTEEIPPMPQTHRQDLRKNLEKVHEADDAHMTGIIENLRAMVNGHQKPNKTGLSELLRQMELVKGHRASNTAYAVQKAEEAVGAIENDLRGGLALMASQVLGDEGQFAKALMPGEDDVDEGSHSSGLQKTSKNKVDFVPIPEDHPPLEIPVIPIEDMTADDLARELSLWLKSYEADPKHNTKENKEFGTVQLYGSGAYATGKGRNEVRVTYIAYQGGTKLNKEEAREYLRFLRKGKFASHYQVLFENKT